MGLLAALLAAPVAAAAVAEPQAGPQPGLRTSYERIPGHGGVELGAFVVTPIRPGPHPLLVMPASWTMPSAEYLGAAKKLAASGGYAVISYAARGFGDSGGEIEVAGPEDIADARRVIDWGLANRRTDPAKIGMAGISYGAGISLLTAAEDDRVRSVSAMSGWADLARSLYPNETINVQAAEMLLAAGKLTGRPGEALRYIEEEYRKGNIEAALQLAPERSAATKIDKLNANGTSIMLANAWQDGIFPPDQYAEFFTGLHTPKRLMFYPGDHGTQDAPGALGLPNEIWDNTNRWFDHHLRGEDNGVDTENPVQLKPSNGGDWLGYPDWNAADRQRTMYLGDGEIRDEPASGWQHTIDAGEDTVAGSGTIMTSGLLLATLKLPVGVAVPLIDRSKAGVWAGPVPDTDTLLTGTPRLKVTVTPSAPDTSLFAYLYDTGPAGDGALITHKPVTLRDAEPGEPQRLDLALDPMAWNLPAGHHLTLVLDTMDPRYTSESARGSTVTFGS
ncbi:MAG: CocE/NonD family hydrolase [Pseudonocardiaceae bacterium]|nr:CocE/NonD family hydrolase [Pseudonocardiaceae bacterium]